MGQSHKGRLWFAANPCIWRANSASSSSSSSSVSAGDEWYVLETAFALHQDQNRLTIHAGHVTEAVSHELLCALCLELVLVLLCLQNALIDTKYFVLVLCKAICLSGFSGNTINLGLSSCIESACLLAWACGRQRFHDLTWTHVQTL